VAEKGTFVHQSRGRKTEETPLVRSLDESLALNEEREGKDCRRLADAGLAFGGAQEILRAARHTLYLK